MSLDFAILGWLSTGPGSGYDLVRQMDVGLGWFWSASHSQIYPRLKALEADGLIASEPVTVGRRLEKRVYSITTDGLDALRTWVGEPPTYPPNRDSERLRLIFGDHGDLRALRRHFETHALHYQRRRAELQGFYDAMMARTHPRIEARVTKAATPALSELPLALREMAYRGDIERAEMEIAWAAGCLAWLDDFEERHGLGAEPVSAIDPSGVAKNNSRP